MANKLYRSVDVWARVKSGTVVRYRCFQSLESGKYCVQSADFYNGGKDKLELDAQFIELLSEQDPVQRAGGYDTIEATIAAHNRDFEDC